MNENMFDLVRDSMRSQVVSDYTDKLDFLFREFIDLKFVIDERHETDVIANLLYAFMAISICRQDSAVRHNVNIFDTNFKYAARDYAVQLIDAFDSYTIDKKCELKIIELLVCYAKAKTLKIEKYFVEMVKKYEELV